VEAATAALIPAGGPGGLRTARRLADEPVAPRAARWLAGGPVPSDGPRSPQAASGSGFPAGGSWFWGQYNTCWQ